jgi:hypothetical protein
VDAFAADAVRAQTFYQRARDCDYRIGPAQGELLQPLIKANAAGEAGEAMDGANCGKAARAGNHPAGNIRAKSVSMNYRWPQEGNELSKHPQLASVLPRAHDYFRVRNSQRIQTLGEWVVLYMRGCNHRRHVHAARSLAASEHGHDLLEPAFPCRSDDVQNPCRVATVSELAPRLR